MHYDFSAPPSWRTEWLPGGGRGLVLQAPVERDTPERAAIYLLDPLVPAGTLAEQLAQAVQRSLTRQEVVKKGAPQPVEGAAYPGLLIPMRVRVNVEVGGEIEQQDEGRLYVMLDAGTDRLLVVFTGGPKALPLHHAAFEAFLRSIKKAASAASGSPFRAFGD